jgi:putative inorganic carbon (hco3(-)) transporter
MGLNLEMRAKYYEVSSINPRNPFFRLVLIMGFFLTVIYIVITIVSPTQFGPEWAEYHALLYLAGLTALASLPAVLTHRHLKSSVQTYLLIGFIIAIGLSQVANRWFGGAIQSWFVFLPSAAVYFFIVANVTTIRRLKIVTLAAVASGLVLVVEALCGYYVGFLDDIFVLKQGIYSSDVAVQQILRLRGVGFLNDPNDFAQFLLIALALLFVAWRSGQSIANFLLVVLPAGLLLWAIYLTHSRGALIGLAALGLIVARKKLGTSASLILAFGLAVGLLALDFTGGRGISASEGADRLSAWSTGLELFKQAPIFGIGFGNFTNFNEITAHNSFVLCLAELGLVGTTMWLALFVTTTMGLNNVLEQTKDKGMVDGEQVLHRISEEGSIGETPLDPGLVAYQETVVADKPRHYNDTAFATENEVSGATLMEEQSRAENVEYEVYGAGAQAFDPSGGRPSVLEGSEVSKLPSQTEMSLVNEPFVAGSGVVAFRSSLIAFMTTSWFLSRTYATTMYLVVGLATAAIAIHDSKTEQPQRRRWLSMTIAVEVWAIVFVYLVVRLRH